jgi:alginate O-acetyltransferase complex protein AlgI
MAWIGVMAYAFQIYFDFSAYSDMAIGLGRMFGFRFPENFDSPYRAKNITEFWKRWHISLSSFLRDYLYIPLGGNRKGTGRTYLNLLTVMVIGGLWHGAQWTFVIWGAIHGLLLMAERALGKKAWYGAMPAPVRVALTFVILLFTWVFFRADSLESALRYLSAMFGFPERGASAIVLQSVVLNPLQIFSLSFAILATWLLPNTASFLEKITLPRCLLGMGLLFLGVRQLFYQGFNPFLYFQF